MPYQRIHSHHIGFDGTPCDWLGYRIMASHTRHWGSYEDPLPSPLNQSSTMAEITVTPKKMDGWIFTVAVAHDHSKLIGNNFGGMLTIGKRGWFGNR